MRVAFGRHDRHDELKHDLHEVEVLELGEHVLVLRARDRLEADEKASAHCHILGRRHQPDQLLAPAQLLEQPQNIVRLPLIPQHVGERFRSQLPKVVRKRLHDLQQHVHSEAVREVKAQVFDRLCVASSRLLLRSLGV